MSNIMPDSTTDSEHACAIVWDAETRRGIHEMMERTGHPCGGTVGGDCPVLPRSTSSIAKQHAAQQVVAAYAEQQAATA
jgi:molybdopterin-guanine dinucleotide biosynthesis protein A